jgi:hypothetical protein
MHKNIGILQTHDMLLTNKLRNQIYDPILIHPNPIFGLSIEQEEHEQHTKIDHTYELDEDNKKTQNELDENTKEDEDKFENEDKIDRIWEEFQFKRKKLGIVYEKNEHAFFRIPNHSKLVKFLGANFLNDQLQRKLLMLMSWMKYMNLRIMMKNRMMIQLMMMMKNLVKHLNNAIIFIKLTIMSFIVLILLDVGFLGRQTNFQKKCQKKTNS